MKTIRSREISGGISAPYQKTPKPHVERRRRAKVTEHIHQIRMLVPAGKTTASSACRLERAEILEQAVNHIQDFPHSQGDSDGGLQLAAGYMECLQEALQCLSDPEHAEMRAKLCGYVADMLERRMATPSNNVIYLQHPQLPGTGDIARTTGPQFPPSPGNPSFCMSPVDRDFSGVPHDIIRGGQWFERHLISPDTTRHGVSSPDSCNVSTTSVELDSPNGSTLNISQSNPGVSRHEGSYRSMGYPGSLPFNRASSLGTSNAGARLALTPSPPLHTTTHHNIMQYTNAADISQTTPHTRDLSRRGYMIPQQVPQPVPSWDWNPAPIAGQMYGYSY